MNLKTQIRSELWLSIAKTYESENYSHAILDAIQYLSDVLREKSGLDGDGVALVGAALGGKSPKIMITKQHTETEKNIQQGMQDILRGIYRGIRNPRSHEEVHDDKATADAIIGFVNYLIGVLGAAEEKFTVPKFLARVHDPDFVDSERYVELLVSEIPPKRHLDTVVELYRNKHEGDFVNARRVIDAILPYLSDDERSEYVGVVSEELKKSREPEDFMGAFSLLPPDLWNEIEEVARHRAEKKAIRSIEEGEASPSEGSLYMGRIGVSAASFLPRFIYRKEAIRTLIGKLAKRHRSEQAYVIYYFGEALPVLVKTVDNDTQAALLQLMMRGLLQAAESGEEYISSKLRELAEGYPTELKEQILAKLNEGSWSEESDSLPF
jgi:uncharacterized protein (TIGR02391 family)